MKLFTRRDLTIVRFSAENCLVISCDSCGGIGMKEGDSFRLPPRYAAKFTARVALTEVLCAGARPVTITNGVANEMKPTAAETIKGIREELKNAGIEEVVLTGSTEENFITNMTAMAITVIGIAEESRLRFKKAESGDKLILLGQPRVGAEVDLENTGFYKEINGLLYLPEVKEIVPVGSKGIAYEADIAASLSDKKFRPFKTGIDYNKSAGPATCLMLVCAESGVDYILNNFKDTEVIGEII